MATLPKNDFRILDPKKVRIQPDEFGRLFLMLGIEERYGPVRPVRALPLTQPDRYISIQDEEGEEIGVIPEMGQLDKESRRALEEELELYYLKAKIQSIQKVEARNGIIAWDVTTSMGSKTVYVRDRQNIRPLMDGRIVLTDIYQGKYEIPPMEQLDEKSRHWLEVET